MSNDEMKNPTGSNAGAENDNKAYKPLHEKAPDEANGEYKPLHEKAPDEVNGEYHPKHEKPAADNSNSEYQPKHEKEAPADAVTAASAEAVTAEAPPKKKKSWFSKFNKKNEISIAVLSFAISFTILFFAPVDIFLGNMRDFVVNFKYVAGPMALAALAATAALIIVQNFLLAIAEWLYQVIARLLFGFLLAIYTQNLLLNNKMATITGDSVEYADDKKLIIWNIFILSVILLIPLDFYIIAKFKPKSKFFNFGKGAVMPYVSGLIVVMQLTGFLSAVAKADFNKYNRQYTQYLAYSPAMSLSEEGNVVVFLTDRLDSYYMDDTLEAYPELNDKLAGFTFYQNNISHNTNTFPSIPQMLTNELYRGTEWPDYTQKAWEGRTLPKILTENGYDCNLLIDNLTTYTSLGQLDGQCHNVKDGDKDNIHMNYIKKGGIVPTMAQLAAAKLSPYVWKNDITNGLGSNLSQEFLTYEQDVQDMMPMAVGVDSDLQYYEYIMNHPLDADNDNKTFSFIHLNCAHGASAEEAALYDPDEPVNTESTIRGDFEILFEYMDQMKKLGVYDNSTIIILGDHGRPPVEIEVDGEEGLTSPIMTALLIKPANAGNEPLKKDRYSELSNDFFAASVLQYAGIDHSELGVSYQDVIENDLHPDRYMQTFCWGGYGKVIYKTLYRVTGDARDWANWEALEGHE